MSDTKKILLIVNPKAGKNNKRFSATDVVDKISSKIECEFTIKYTERGGHATELVKEFIDGHDIVVCCGGDGTLNEVINGVMQLERRVPIGYIPCGSTNDLANSIGIPSDIDKACDLIADGHINGYDIGLFNNKYFTYVASFGPGTSISYSTPQKLKNIFGHAAYMVNGFVLQLVPMLKQVKPHHIVFEYDGNVVEDNFYFAAFSNATSVGGIFRYNTDDILFDDGKFEVLLVRKLRGPLDTFRMLGKIIKRDYDGDTLIYFKASNIKMTFETAEPWTLDGEFGGNHKEVRVTLLHKAVDLITPVCDMFSGNAPEPVFVREEKKKRKKTNTEEIESVEEQPEAEKTKEQDSEE